MNYKEIKQHNRREQKLPYASWDNDVCGWTHKADTIDIYEFICKQATSDEGMTLNHKCLFHAQNPNGLVAQLPKYEDFILIDEPTKVNMGWLNYERHQNFHAKQLDKFSWKQSGFTAWDVNYHIEDIKLDIVKSKEHMIKHNLVGSLAA